ncbi:MAG TPA: O-antigen ligase family protein [Rhodoferax sp.]|nr:O-antigen ligase family protein [Rhodoferax sp.]
MLAPMIEYMALTDTTNPAADRTVTVLAGMAFLLPAVGSASEMLAQDTLKSAIAACSVFLAALVFLWNKRPATAPWLWHSMLGLPLTLMVYALGSVVWSHGYLASVETTRWFLLALLAWLGLNAITTNNLPRLLWGIHAGLVVASLWAMLQFWLDFSLFAQGPPPASTFYNRNFFGEYAVCALPFSVWLLSTVKSPRGAIPLAMSLAAVVTAILMTGTRSALIALALTAPLLVATVVRYRTQLPCGKWTRRTTISVVATFLTALTVLGNIPSYAVGITQERTGVTAWNRGTVRVASMAQPSEYTEGSFSVRSQMWRATLRMAMENPFAGVGAGAWEVHIPRFQRDDTVLEIDYYAHNEYLQLLSEYGLPLGGFVLAFLAAFWIHSVDTTWRVEKTAPQEAPLRGFVLTGMLAMGIVSMAGFPWHLAGCGVLFALSFSLLCGSDIRMGSHLGGAFPPPTRKTYVHRAVLVTLLICMAIAVYTTIRAVHTERTLVQALLLAKNLSKSKDTWGPEQQASKDRMLNLVREGIHLNPHYRKLTPLAAEFLMVQGDWANAAWILKSVTDSRPHVAALWKGQALAHAQMHQSSPALNALQQVQRLRPDTKATQNLEIVVLSNVGQAQTAAQLLRTYFATRNYDYEMVQAGYALGLKLRDNALAVQALQLRNQTWPEQAADGFFRMGLVHAQTMPPDHAAALEAFASGLSAVPAQEKENYLRQVPLPYRNRLDK